MIKRSAAMIASLTLGLALIQPALADDDYTEGVRARIRPVSLVQTSDELQAAQDASQAANQQVVKRAPKQIYTEHCAACHATGIANAPKFRSASWASRSAKGMDTMLKHAVHGLNAMPPKGLCMDCSKDEIRATIKYMLPKKNS